MYIRGSAGGCDQCRVCDSRSASGGWKISVSMNCCLSVVGFIHRRNVAALADGFLSTDAAAAVAAIDLAGTACAVPVDAVAAIGAVVVAVTMGLAIMIGGGEIRRPGGRPCGRPGTRRAPGIFFCITARFGGSTRCGVSGAFVCFGPCIERAMRRMISSMSSSMVSSLRKPVLRVLPKGRILRRPIRLFGSTLRTGLG